MADLYTGLFDGADSDAIVINAIASETIAIFSPVSLVAPATGERLARVAYPSGQGVYVFGVVVGGDANGIPVDGTIANDGNAAAAAGDTVKVCTFGRCKVRVNGSTAAIAVGEALVADAVDGFAEDVADATDDVFARAMVASTGAADLIVCQVGREGIQT